MLAIFFQTVPFFSMIGLGYGAARTGLFEEGAGAVLTRFVFFFALPALLFRFSANLRLDEIFDLQLALAYLYGTALVYLLGFLVAQQRGQSIAVCAVEAQCGAIGNTGFLGIPMLAMILGEEAIPAILLVLMLDSVLFSSILTILVIGSRGGERGVRLLGTVARSVASNPMVFAIVLGLMFSASGLQMPEIGNAFLELLGAAATPGALFAIGASLASKSAERIAVAGWMSFVKLILHPLAVWVSTVWIFEIDPFSAAIVVSAASLPVAGNIFILAQHYGVAPQRVSASILFSTIGSIFTVTIIIALLVGESP